VATNVRAEETEGKPQTVCPVMGGKINKAVHADVGGKRVYLCCRGCIRTVQKDPDKYLEKLKKQGVTLADAPQGECDLLRHACARMCVMVAHWYSGCSMGLLV